MIRSVEGVAHVQLLGEGAPALLIEVPHGTPFQEMQPEPAALARLAGPLAALLAGAIPA